LRIRVARSLQVVVVEEESTSHSARAQRSRVGEHESLLGGRAARGRQTSSGAWPLKLL